ncbi:MAG TPA: hypothetical protein PLJ21_08560 [Pseudobdellovibrionaceae bacterium]|nr:hypothetical protein [Pseudobdellovibrionaceae bacterium]
MNAFIARNHELGELKRLKNKKTASLICILGRRRIGKSALVLARITQKGEFLILLDEISWMGRHDPSTSKRY